MNQHHCFMILQILALIQDFMTRVAAVVGRRPPAIPLPNTAIWAAGLAGSIGGKFDAHRFAGLDRNVLRSMQQVRFRTDAKARRDLGLTPRPLEEGIEAAYAWFRAHGYC